MGAWGSMWRIAVCLVMLVIAGGALAQSEGPPPSIGEQGQAQPHPAQQSPAAEQQRPAQPPITVNVIAPQKTEAERADEQRERQEKADLDRRLVDFTAELAAYTGRLYYATVAVAIATIFLVIATAILAIFGRVQSRDMKASVAVAEKAATAAMIGARAAQKSADTAEKAFSYVERPYVFAFGVERLEVEPDRVGAVDTYRVGYQPFVTYSVANYGKTPAIIENVRAGFCISESQPEGPTRVDDTNDMLTSPIMEAGERRDKLQEGLPEGIERSLFVGSDGTYAIPAMKNTEDLFFRIIIDYRGAFTEGHESSFCWRYDKSTAHFVQHGHKDYNYVA
jgi:hypothetical protein